MKVSTLDILCCPVCKGDLELTVLEKTELNSGEEDIIEGSLRCAKCSVDYPISEGIPNLLPKEPE